MPHQWICEEHKFSTFSGRAWGIHKVDHHGGVDPRKPPSPPISPSESKPPATAKPSASSAKRSTSGSTRSGPRGDPLVKAMLAEASAQRESAVKAIGRAERLEDLASDLSTP